MKRSKRSKCAEPEIGNTANNPGLHWLLTVNKKDIEETDDNKRSEKLTSLLKNFCENFKYQLEKGTETGYEHFQVYIKTKNKIRMTGIKRYFPFAHIEKAHNINACIDYVQKDDTSLGYRVSYDQKDHIYDHIDIIKESEFYDWEKEIMETIKLKADSRTIHWYWSEHGNKGKTCFSKYLCIKHDALYIKGKKNDMLYACAERESKIIIIDLSRTMEDHVPYEAIEDIKNGIYFSGKYESKQIIRNCPHVYIFANFEPCIEKLSKDRWHIVEID